MKAPRRDGNLPERETTMAISQAPRRPWLSLAVAALLIGGLAAPAAWSDDEKKDDADKPVVEEKQAEEKKADAPKLDADKAIAEIQKVGGKVDRDDKAPDKPVTNVNLAISQVTDEGVKKLKEALPMAKIDR